MENNEYDTRRAFKMSESTRIYSEAEPSIGRPPTRYDYIGEVIEEIIDGSKELKALYAIDRGEAVALHREYFNLVDKAKKAIKTLADSERKKVDLVAETKKATNALADFERKKLGMASENAHSMENMEKEF